MIQLSVSSTAACDSLQIGRPPFLNRAPHLDFGVIEWSKMIDIWGTQNETKTDPQLDVCTSVVDTYSPSQATIAREIEARSLWSA